MIFLADDFQAEFRNISKWLFAKFRKNSKWKLSWGNVLEEITNPECEIHELESNARHWLIHGSLPPLFSE